MFLNLDPENHFYSDDEDDKCTCNRKGIYIYTVARWSVSGSREIERLEYVVHSLGNGVTLDGDSAEALVNVAALDGKDWLSAGAEVDNDEAARLQDACRADLEEEFVQFRDAHKREDADRIRLMVKSLQQHLEKKRMKAMDRRIMMRYLLT